MVSREIWINMRLRVFQRPQIASGVASPTISSRYANSKLLSLFISLEIDCFHSQ
jgi:hypothetical protein